MIILMKNEVDWELICQEKHMQINRDNARKNKHRVDYDYKVVNEFMLTNHTSYKYGTPYTGPFVITQCSINGKLMLQYGAIQIRHNICRIKPYKSDTKFE